MFGDVNRFIVPHLISKLYLIIYGIRTYLIYQNDIQFPVNKPYIPEIFIVFALNQ
jgi:hypothetical protein